MKRYQIFISSTYTDLQLERQAVLQSVLKLRHIPVGMEHFVATNEEQFNYIKRILDETDYYIVIVGNRYGSQADDGVSYTEKEFDYAVSLGIPVIACIHGNPDSLPINKSDIEVASRQKLNEFRNKIMHHRMVSYFNWNSPADLSAEAVVALVNTISDHPRPGWERVGSYENSDLLNQINDLRIENNRMKSLLSGEKESEERQQLIMQFPWNEIRTFEGYSYMDDYRGIFVSVSLSWLQIFSVFGPILLLKSSVFSVHHSLNEALFLNHVPHFCVPDSDLQLIVAEFLKYGIIDVLQNKKGEKSITLTKEGKQCLHKIRVPVDEKLSATHSQVLKIYNDITQKQQEEKSNN